MSWSGNTHGALRLRLEQHVAQFFIVQKLIVMKRKNYTYPSLGVLVKKQRLLREAKEGKAIFERLYFNEVTGNSKLERRLRIEIERMAFYCGCAEFLQTAIVKAQTLNTQTAQDILTEYGLYKRKAYADFVCKSKHLNKIEISVDGKDKVLFADSL